MVLPVLAGTLLVVALTIGRGIVSDIEGHPAVAHLRVRPAEPVLPARVDRDDRSAASDARAARRTVGGSWPRARSAAPLLGWVLTNVIVARPPFEDPKVAIDVPTGIGMAFGIVIGFAVAAFLLLPNQVRQVARRRDYTSLTVSWTRRTRSDPLGRHRHLPLLLDHEGVGAAQRAAHQGRGVAAVAAVLPRLVATIVWSRWVAEVQGGVNELVMGEADVAPGVPLAEDGLPEELPELPEPGRSRHR